MIVFYNNKKYDLDMPFRVFWDLQNLCPQHEVEITERTSSTYKKVISVPIWKLEDYSIARNKQALNLPIRFYEN